MNLYCHTPASQWSGRRTRDSVAAALRLRCPTQPLLPCQTQTDPSVFRHQLLQLILNGIMVRPQEEKSPKWLNFPGCPGGDVKTIPGRKEDSNADRSRMNFDDKDMFGTGCKSKVTPHLKSHMIGILRGQENLSMEHCHMRVFSNIFMI